MLESDDTIDVQSLGTPHVNSRVYYAIQAVAAEPVNDDNIKLGQKLKLQGLQSIGINTSLDLEPVLQLGTLETYAQRTRETNIEMSLTKVIDNKTPLYLMLTQGTEADSSGKNIYKLNSRKSDMYFGIWNDMNTAASGESISVLQCTGMMVSGLEYNFTVDELIETVTLQGGHKAWLDSTLEAQNPQQAEKVVVPGYDCETCPVPETEYFKPDNVVVAKRWNLDFQGSTLPSGSGGINVSPDNYKIISINIKCNINREKIYELGSHTPAYQTIINPTTINFSVEMLMSPDEFSKFHEYGGDKKYVATLVEDQSKHPVQYDFAFPFDTDEGFESSDPAPCTIPGTKIKGPNGNLNFCTTEIPKHTFPKTILLKVSNCNDTDIPTQEDTDIISFDLGSDNRIQSIDYSNNTSGQNMIVRYNFVNYNYFSIIHSKVEDAGRFTAANIN